MVITLVLTTKLSARPSTPIPTCANVYELAAYKMAIELVEMCSGANFNKVKKHVLIAC